MLTRPAGLTSAAAVLTAAMAIVIAGCASQETEPVAEVTETAEPSVTSVIPEPQKEAVSDLGPAETLDAMLTAYFDKRLGEYYHYVSSSDKEIKSLDSLQAEFAPARTDLVTDFLFHYTRFVIDSTLVFGDSAMVYVTSTSPPVQVVMHHGNIVERDMGPDAEMGQKLSLLGERYKLAGAPREENNAVYRLIREQTGWKVNVGWAEMAAWLDERIAEREARSGAN